MVEAEIRTKIVNACAARQAVYEAKRAAAFQNPRPPNYDRFDVMTFGVEVVNYVLRDVLVALGMPTDGLTADEPIDTTLSPSAQDPR